MIKNKRKKIKLTQSQLAKKLNISKGYMNKLENKLYGNVTVKIILNMSTELDISPVRTFLFFKEQYERNEQ